MKPSLYAAMKPFATRAGQIRMFDLLLQDVLPKTMAGRVRVLNVREGILVLGVDHAALATQVRFQSPQWLPRLNAAARTEGELPTLAAIDIRITAEAQPRKMPKITRELTAETRTLLMDMAAHETDAHLAQTLRRLARAGTARKRGEIDE